MASTVTARAPAWADGIAVSGAEMRAAIEGTKWASAGIVRGLVVSQIPTPAMQIRVTAGLSVVSDGQNGYVPLELAAQTDLDIGGSSPTLNRIDSLIAEFVDNGASSLYRYRIVAGTAASSPSQPTLPYSDQPTGKTLRIANIAIAANASNIVNANITMQTSTAILASYGRVLLVAADGGRPSSPVVSERIWRTDKSCFEIWDGTAWREDTVANVGPAWTSYTPTWTATTTNPTLGNGTLVGRYTQRGKTVSFRIVLTTGSTTSYGSGQYILSLPVNPNTTVTNTAHCRLLDSSAGVAYPGMATLFTSTTIPQAGTGASGALSTVTNTNPFTFASGDEIRIWGTYEAA